MHIEQVENEEKRKIAMTKRISLAIAALAVSLALTGCPKGDKNAPADEFEAMNSGKLDAYVDEAIYPQLDTCFGWYRAFYENVDLTTEKTTARKAMSMLLSGNARAIIVARDYLKDEDSLMSVFKVKPFQRILIAEDALVFFNNPALPIDTLNAEKIRSYFGNRNSKPEDLNPKLAVAPEFVTLDQNSSVWANFNKMALRGLKLEKPIKMFSTVDSVVKYVSKTPNAIGIGYLSQVIRNLDIRLIPIGFIDSAKKYVNPKPVHQAYMVQRLYPYIVPYYAYLLEDRKNLPFWFATYLGKEAKVQKYFKELGIVPAYAKIKLIPEE